MIEGYAQINACQEMSKAEADLCRMAELERRKVRPIDEELCNIAYERGQLGERIRNLEAAIKADPPAVSEKHKKLWHTQLFHMKGYYNALGERINDFVEQTEVVIGESA